MLTAAVFIFSYFFGGVPWGYLIARAKGVDIREQGSGNVGATNVTRALGLPYGALCFFLDFLKGLLPVLGVTLLLPALGLATGEWTVIAAIFGTMAGHIWCPFLGFKGGKGVATGAGALSAVSLPGVACAFIVWLAVYKSTRYVSLASVLAAAVLPLAGWLFSALGIWRAPPLLIAFLFFASFLAIVKHRSNIARLWRGTEHRFEKR